MNLGQCIKCKREAIISIGGERPLCAKHYVEQEDEGCLRAFLQSDPPDEVVKEVKKQKPRLYEEVKNIFE